MQKRRRRGSAAAARLSHGRTSRWRSEPLAVQGARGPAAASRGASARRERAGPKIAAGERILGDFGAEKSIPLKNSRCAPHQTDPKTVENRDFAIDNRKNEDPAKMTHSIPDFVNQSSNIFPILRERVTNIQYQYLERCKSIFSETLSCGQSSLSAVDGITSDTSCVVAP